MWTISDVKAKGKAALKGNYWRSVFAAILLGLFAGWTGYNFATRSGQSAQGEGALLSSQQLILSPDQQQAFLTALLAASAVVIVVSLLLKIFLINPLEVGSFRFFRKNVEDQNTTLGTIGEGFSQYGHVFGTLFLRDLFLMLWGCLFLIPAIVKSYSYRMVPYILKDNPELSATEVITKSRKMMDGNKWKAFLLDLSFIGWLLLAALTLGIVGVFWTNPYMANANAALYLELKES